MAGSGHLVRSLRLAPFATSAAAVTAYLVARLGDTHDAIGDLRVLGLLLALGSSYALDDSAAITLQASPYGLARRLWLRIACAVAFVVPVWAAPTCAGQVSRSPRLARSWPRCATRPRAGRPGG
ncbi:hypothetical protein AB0M79_34775 [Polymorphospora sp. NPDC051019]|uniref:hypothetical protein n=1 Tax=Polymorphospora sp. NPDC051019 TaxID=3155725 RepID=UPI00343611D4